MSIEKDFSLKLSPPWTKYFSGYAVSQEFALSAKESDGNHCWKLNFLDKYIPVTAKDEKTPLRWVREHSLLFGIFVGIAFGVLLILAMVVDLRFVEWLIVENTGWLRLAAYTIVVFAILAKNYSPSSPSLRFWTLLAGLLLLHLVCSVWFILNFRPLGAIHYMVYGPFEVLLLALLMNRGVRYLGIIQDND